MASSIEFPNIDGSTFTDRAIATDYILDGQGSSAINGALSAMESNAFHMPVSSIMNSSFVKSKGFAPGTARYKADRARWVQQVSSAAKLKQAILQGKHNGNIIAESYKAWMALSTAGRARSIIANLYYFLMEVDNKFNIKGAAFLATAAAYSYLGEGDCDPLAAENHVFNGANFKIVPYPGKPLGTGIGFQQWSFYRNDDLIINIEKWTLNKQANSMGTILPSPTVQFMFAVKEVINNNPKIVSICNKPDANINEVLAHFLQIQNGEGYAGRCIQRLLKSRGKLNNLNVVSGDFKADMDAVLAYGKNINPGGKACPNVPNH